MPRSFLDFEGVYDKTKRYLVNNWSDESFTQEFGSETAYNDNRIITTSPAYSITLKPGEMRELGQFEALMITKHFVDREIFKVAAKLADKKERESAENAVNNPTLRKPFEDKTISEIKLGEETPFMDKIRAEIRAEEIAKLKTTKEDSKKEDNKKDEKSTGEFDGVK